MTPPTTTTPARPSSPSRYRPGTTWSSPKKLAIVNGKKFDFGFTLHWRWTAWGPGGLTRV
ncbi:hypothetical protein [Saccharothrix hoggarensis]|uniref:Uncharacterized protein n=1 Tax=Saccharothrix hoggarensis TaxID=913853 RepID=A0ABW3QIR5_9PSEU